MEHEDIFSVILPTKNNADHIEDLIISIFSQTPNRKIEIIVLDSSDDDTPLIVKKLFKKYDIKMYRVEPEDYNYGGTRNLGVKYSKGNFLIFISTDIDIFDSFWLTKLYKNFKNERVAGVHGRQIPKKNTPPQEEFFIKYTYPNQRREYDLSKKGYVENFFFSNTNTMIRRQVMEQIPLPEMLKSEDHEWGKRALQAGYMIIYDPEAAVHHSHTYSLKQVFKEYYDSGATMPYVQNSVHLKTESFLIRGIRYEKEEIKYFMKNGYSKHLPYTFVYNFTKFMGYFLGTQYKYTPKWIRIKFSRASNYWNNENDIIL